MQDDKTVGLVVRPEKSFKEQGSKRKKLLYSGKPDTTPADVMRFPGSTLIVPEITGKPRGIRSAAKKAASPKKRKASRWVKKARSLERRTRTKVQLSRRLYELEARVELLEGYAETLIAENRKMSRLLRNQKRKSPRR